MGSFNPTSAELALRNDLMKAAVRSGCTFQEVMSALGYVRCVLSDKGDNLLNAVNIQEVVKMERC
nr:hypothetical protein [uncultured Agathobaculum sp.]